MNLLPILPSSVTTTAKPITFKGLPACLAPHAWRHWLCDTGSLTQRLTQLADGDFRVHVLRQQHAPARLSEQRHLALPPRTQPWIREVLLVCRGTPWVYARSVIPRATERGAGRHLTRLGTRPLGAVLFSDPQVRRGTIWLRHETLANPLLTATHQLPDTVPLNWPSQPLWGRQCMFHLGQAPILVSEYFLAPCVNKPPTAHLGEGS